MSVTTPTKKHLTDEITRILSKQGYKVLNDGTINLKKSDRESKKKAHLLSKAERILSQEDFVLKNIPLVSQYIVNGAELDVQKIKPKVIEVTAGSKWEILFRWWSLVWWSLPNERSYGRQMRFIVWDDYHKAPIGLIGLQSPILSWNVRDKYLGITTKARDYWINQSLSAQRLGALPPYNYILGGKLVASILTTNLIRKRFEEKYADKRTLIKNRKIPARLLFITTTGAYGKSSVYSRLKVNGKEVAKFLGYSSGVGSFHIPNYLYEQLIKYLESKNIDTARGYGNGPSRKLRLIDGAMDSLGFQRGIKHSIERGVYLFPLVYNLHKVISENKNPQWINRSVSEVARGWKERWAVPRSVRDTSYKDFSKAKFIEETKQELEGFKKTFNKIRNG